MIEKNIFINEHSIKYIFKERRYDNNHLVVVFSGFGGRSEFTYDFLNVFKNIRANVLWIKDDFHDHCSYYLCHKNNFSIEKSVITFINKVIDDLAISKSNVTLVGASKGGSAALYYGIKYDFSNIVSSVPQLLIGNYVSSVWPVIGNHMMGDEKDIDYLNSLIKKHLKNDANLNKNIYILTSEADSQYKEHIAPFLKYFYKYGNINIMFSESILVREHNQITAHHTDIIMGIISMLSSNCIPKIGVTSLYGDESVTKIEKPVSIVELKNVYVNSGRLYLDGIGIVRGKEASRYDQINYKLVLVSDKNIELGLAKGHRPQLTRQYYNGSFCIYDKCWFTTHKYKGIDISNIPEGIYQLCLEIKFSDYSITVPLDYKGTVSSSMNHELEIDNRRLLLRVH